MPVRGAIRWAWVAVVAWSLAIPCGVALAQTGPIANPAVRDTIIAYLRDQRAGRRDLLRMAHQLGNEDPPAVRLLVADAYLRSGQMTAARRILQAVLDGNDGPPWTSFADLVLGWMAFGTGRLGAARTHYARIADWDLTRETVPVALGLIDAADGREAEATAGLAAAAASAQTPKELRALAKLGIGYAHYWSGRFDAAAGSFEAVSTQEPASVFVDDATYGAAWSWWRLGDQDRALARLHAMAASGAGEGEAERRKHPRLPLALVNLEPRAVLRASMKRYRDVSLDRPDEQLVRLLDMNGRDLAESALLRMEEGLAPATLSDRPMSGHATEDSDGAAEPPPSARVPAAAAAPRPAPPQWPAGRLVLLALGVVGVALMLFLAAERRSARQKAGPEANRRAAPRR